jgi:hypothetical protein
MKFPKLDGLWIEFGMMGMKMEAPKIPHSSLALSTMKSQGCGHE